MARTGRDTRGEDRGGKPAVSDREARLKAALKANLARRKAQARARSIDSADSADGGAGMDDRPEDTGDPRQTPQQGEG
ncbi:MULTISPECIES: hypothetical protein [Roseicyclus]|uniref:hypothetical protein n=1 Tax=Roseicyclus amphidinii TaxID=3034232 RepID=UPI0024E0E7B9|nr:hypothetical protein [Roseicyclus sp. Amp-Y-6]